MSESLREQLVQAIRARFQTIRTVNGYATDIGAHCFTWRDLEKNPFTADEISDGGAFTLRDPSCTTSTKTCTKHDHELTIECVAVTKGAPPDTWGRRICADLHKAIGVDRKWRVDGVDLAIDTLPGDDKIDVGHYGDRVAAVLKTFTVKFRTDSYDPYNQ